MGGIASATGRSSGTGMARATAAALLFAAVLGLTRSTLAQSTGRTDQQSVRMISSGQAGGGGRSLGGAFSLEGTIGQTVAAPMSGGAFAMRSGFIPMCFTDCELGDIDCDGSVNGSDLGILLLLFGPCPDPFSCPGDLDNNGEVDSGDIGLMMVLWH